MPREPDYSSDDDDPEDFKKAALPVEPGVQRAVWDLAWEGAKKIKGGKIDTGDPADGPRAVPGTYTVRLTVDGTDADRTVRSRSGSASGSASAGRPRSAAHVRAARARRHLEADRRW